MRIAAVGVWLTFAWMTLAGCQPQIAQSHIDAHVPDADSFSRLLNRDLKAYFDQSLPHRALRVEHQLLRDAPTQSGIAFPKYYVWVKVHHEGALVIEGAVRVAAVDQLRFDVTDFLSRDQILADPSKVEMVFPKALNEKIMRMAAKPAH